MKKIKILQINKLYYPITGGIEKVVQQIAEGLKDKVDMEVLTCQRKGKSHLDIVNGVKVHRAGSLGVLYSVPISLSFIWKLKKLSKDCDILQFHMPFPLGDIAELLSGYKGKVIVWWHSDVVKQEKFMKLYKPVMYKFLKRADVIIVATQGHIEGSHYLKPFTEKCIIIPYGVDKKIEEASDKYLLHKQDQHIHKKNVSLLFVGRLVYYKGCEVLLEAFIKTTGVDLTIVGDGVLRDKLEKLVERNGIEKRVKFLGNINDELLRAELERCDILVLPSTFRSEAFGLVQIEAMSYGKPVINTNLDSGVPYVSIDKETGLTVPPNDVETLAEAIQWMVDHEEERLLMGKRAKQRVKDNYRLDTMLDKLLNVYKDNCEN